MLSLNKYLRDLDINEKSWLFSEVELNTRLFNEGFDHDPRYVEKAPLTDGRIIEGFIHAEFFNMDATLNMLIYSYLCYFKEFISIFKSDEFNRDLDIMIEGFKLSITTDDNSKRGYRKILRARRLFIKNFDSFWY